MLDPIPPTFPQLPSFFVVFRVVIKSTTHPHPPTHPPTFHHSQYTIHPKLFHVVIESRVFKSEAEIETLQVRITVRVRVGVRMR